MSLESRKNSPLTKSFGYRKTNYCYNRGNTMKKSRYYQAIGSLLVAFFATTAQAGDAAAGEATYTSMGCVGCHGQGGNSMVPMFPALAGVDEAFIVSQLIGFRSGEVAGSTMQPMAASLTDEQIANLAAYLSAQ
jgi:cytochrome c553